MIKYAAASSLMLTALPSLAQDMTEEIEATGIRASEMYETMPAVTLKKTADFLAQRIMIINDSRSEDQRNSEIRETLQKDALITFIKSAKKSGRTEIDIPNGIDLSVISPERYRNEIIKKIGEENQAIKRSIGDNCTLTIDGLGNRVEWEQSGMTELMLYIPYNIQITCQ